MPNKDTDPSLYSAIKTLHQVLWVVSVAVGLLALSHCNPDDTPPPEPVDSLLLDSTPVSYGEDVLKVLNSGNCLGCHSDDTKQGNLSLEGYENFKKAADDETLLRAIKHQSGAVPMPLDRDKLSAEKIAVIERWIIQGAKEN